MIVATAGHIDHGKTALVKALTGVETDRLPEEKRRGLSIDLGFAYVHAPDGATLGFVDVPGHERFIRNMLAGISGVEFALLVIAADDGPMPQTAEHLAIIDLLGLKRGAVAISKCDRVPAARVDEAMAEARRLVDSTSLAGAPIFPVSAISGDGVDALLEHLWLAARATPRRAADGGFRLTVDRAFALAGSGLIVTGSVFAGGVRVGDRLTLSPSGAEVRVRGIHTQSRPANVAEIGDRCALNLVGADLRRSSVRRGDWVLEPRLHAPTDRLDARLRLLPDAARPLRDWTPVHLHLGAAEVGARVAVLEGRAIAPGADALVQLALDHPIGALFGDRLIVRDASARSTLGGGSVIDPWAPRRGRRRPERRATLAALALPEPARALAALLAESTEGIDAETYVRARNLSAAAWNDVRVQVPFESVPVQGHQRAFAPERWQAIRKSVLDMLADHYAATPGSRGLSLQAIRRIGAPPSLIEAALAALVAEGKAIRSGNRISLPDRFPDRDPDEILWAQVRPLIGGDGLRPPTVSDLAAGVGASVDDLSKFLARMARKGRVVGIAKNRYCDAGAVAELGRLAEVVAASQGGKITAAAFRDRAQIGRNLAIEVLEYFDRAGFTRRVGDARHVVRPATAVFRRSPDAMGTS